jgi:hypothetical protein
MMRVQQVGQVEGVAIEWMFGGQTWRDDENLSTVRAVDHRIEIV